MTTHPDWPTQARSQLPPHVGAAFRDQVARSPDAPAVSDDVTSLTFSELDAGSDSLAVVIRRSLDDAEPRSVVGICAEGANSLVGVLAILKAGAAYLPLTPGTLNPGRETIPHERLQFMLEDAQVGLVIVDERYRPMILHHDVEAILSDRRSAEGSLANPSVKDNDLAYVLYTSGSTGRPKAVMVEHRNVLNLWRALEQDLRLPDRPLNVSVNAPLGFDPSVQQLTFLLSGHHLVVVPDRVRVDGRALLRFVQKHFLEVLDCTPAQLRLLISAGLLEAQTDLVAILCGGEAVDPETWRLLTDHAFPRAYNMYGPTECTVDSTVTPFTGVTPFIGWPLTGTRVYILDERGLALSADVDGEIAVGGPGVARGYLNHPELTAAKFRRVWLDGTEQRLFVTGDRGRRRQDGSIEFLGRLDRQVKMRGYRIELEEVEHTIRRHPRIEDCGVVLRQAGDGEHRLLAYFSVADGVVPVEELRAFMRMWVPDYMVPFAFFQLERVPLTTNGKIDYAALPAPTGQRPTMTTPLVRPTSPLEMRVVSIWARLFELESDSVGILDDFFDSGGDSLMAVELVVALEREFGVELSLDLVLTRRTPSSIAAFLREGALLPESDNLTCGQDSSDRS